MQTIATELHKIDLDRLYKALELPPEEQADLEEVEMRLAEKWEVKGDFDKLRKMLTTYHVTALRLVSHHV